MINSLITTNRQGGFTLIELMVAMLLTIFMAGGVILIHLSGRQASVDAERISRMQENVRFASDYLVRDIRNAGFRDETFLRLGHETQIREQYATFVDGDGDGVSEELRVRYAGRGHCTEAFNEFRLVENYYYLDGGELTCSGSFVARDDAGDVLIATPNKANGVGMVSGVTGLAFQPICPDGTAVCACDLVNDIENSCIGTRIAIRMEGPQSIDDRSVREDRTVELVAAFRNIILDRSRYLPPTASP
ncbi:MAG: prepilin-type N-terminal cleavage/methylation domain-containing protein [Gammaproteobacteria bacterium]|nr:prepilin-type N-terminal cleavage/methylation domain-containing protein [Gammaproteobacteria bacterium]